MSLSKRRCEVCGDETELRGWVLAPRRAGGGFKREYRWWCRSHFLIWMFNLMPYQCTAECRKEHQRHSEVLLRDENYTWVQWEATMGAATPGHEAKCIPRCPWCGKPMKRATGGVFAEERKVTRLAAFRRKATAGR
jgi:hypothetical protein